MVVLSQPLGFAHTTSSPRLRSGETPNQQSLQTFSQTIASEFIKDSAISPALFQAAIAIVSETEILGGGNVTYSIHEPRGPSPPTANNQPLRPLFSVKSTCEELAQ